MIQYCNQQCLMVIESVIKVETSHRHNIDVSKCTLYDLHFSDYYIEVGKVDLLTGERIKLFIMVVSLYILISVF